MLVYISGYIIKNIQSSIKCYACITSTSTSNDISNSSLLDRNDRGGLRKPSKYVIDILHLLEFQSVIDLWKI